MPSVLDNGRNYLGTKDIFENWDEQIINFFHCNFFQDFSVIF